MNMNGLQQRLEVGPGCLFGLPETLVGALQELLLRAFQELAAHFRELCRQGLSGGGEFDKPRFERAFPFQLGCL